MKKLTTKIMDDGDEKEISVFLDDETAKVLEECGDEELKHRYIVEEYKDKLIERRETRRHQSLEKSSRIITNITVIKKSKLSAHCRAEVFLSGVSVIRDIWIP